MLLGSDLAAALSVSSSRGTSPTEAAPGGISPSAAAFPFRHTPQRSPLPPPRPHNRLTTIILRPTNDCRHFHYETVELGPVEIKLLEEEEGNEPEIDRQKAMRMSVESNGKKWTIARTFADICQLDCQLHRCIFSREHSRLEELDIANSTALTLANIRGYLQRLSLLTGSLMRCYSVLSFFELDNRGSHFHPAEYSQINTPAIACAVAIRPFRAQTGDQLGLSVGDIISVVEMPAESDWWRGKLTVPSAGKMDNSGTKMGGGGGMENGEMDNGNKQVGSFPSTSVRLFSDRLSLGEQIWLAAQPKPGAANANAPNSINRRRSAPLGKLLSSPIGSPSAPRLKSLLRLALPTSPGGGGGASLRNAVFGRELAQFGAGVPKLVKECVAVIERDGIVPGIYRQCGVQSNIRRLRREFSHPHRCPQWNSPQMSLLVRHDIHAVPSMLKQFFRQLPDPLLQFHIHSRLIGAFGDSSRTAENSEQKLAKVRSLLEEMAPANFNTGRCLFHHLQRISRNPLTEMNARNLAIVWAPNLLKCPPAQLADWPNQLAGLDMHTDICAFLIANADALFGPEEMTRGMEAKPKASSPAAGGILPPAPTSVNHHRRKRNSLICTSGNVQPIETTPKKMTTSAEGGGGGRGREEEEETIKQNGQTLGGSGLSREGPAVGSPRWRRFLQTTSNSIENSFHTIMRRPMLTRMASSPQPPPSLGQSSRSQSVDRTKERQPAAGAQRLLSPFGASVMRRVRSVRKSVRKFRPSSSSGHQHLLPPQTNSPFDNEEEGRSSSGGGGGIPFVDENETQPASASSNSICPSPGGEFEKSAEDKRRMVNFEDEEGGEEKEEEEEGEEEAQSVDSIPLDISRYDNVQSSIFFATGGREKDRMTMENSIAAAAGAKQNGQMIAFGQQNGRMCSPEVARLKTKLRPLSLVDSSMDSGEIVYF